jgi:hypothetical protein
MLRRVAFTTTGVSEEHIASIIRVTRIGELGTTLALSTDACCEEILSEKGRVNMQYLVTANVAPSSPILVTLMMKALSASEMSVLTRSTRRHTTEDDILHSQCRENLKSYISDFSIQLKLGEKSNQTSSMVLLVPT